jgi:hypothetical protein
VWITASGCSFGGPSSRLSLQRCWFPLVTLACVLFSLHVHVSHFPRIIFSFATEILRSAEAICGTPLLVLNWTSSKRLTLSQEVLRSLQPILTVLPAFPGTSVDGRGGPSAFLETDELRRRFPSEFAEIIKVRPHRLGFQVLVLLARVVTKRNERERERESVCVYRWKWVQFVLLKQQCGCAYELLLREPDSRSSTPAFWTTARNWYCQSSRYHSHSLTFIVRNDLTAVGCGLLRGSGLGWVRRGAPPFDVLLVSLPLRHFSRLCLSEGLLFVIAASAVMTRTG